MKLLAVTLLCSVVALGAANLQGTYPFNAVLLDEGGLYYELHWNYVSSTETISFAVNVSTTGWVGFGLSPTGSMTGSDVVIGWVSDEGNTYFHDRYAEGRFLPPIDPSQDWFLDNSMEENGFTLLEFSRSFITCDPRDLDITISTARVVWSFSQSDPTDPSGAGAMRHDPDHRGTRSLNLIGGLEGQTTVPASEGSFDVGVSDVTIPSADTTYWCSTGRLPAELVATTHYINRVTPVLTDHDRDYVHHLLVYLCSDPINEEDSDVCSSVNSEIRTCRGGLLVGAWAVGGTEFVYPEGIAYPVGGTGQEQFLVIEVHYDNPNEVAGVLDNSGLRFFYTSEAPEQNAGIMFLGHAVAPIMLVPPKTERYTVSAICTADCTNQFIPEDGIRIFGNALHTHLVGRALTIQHFRMNSECGVLEELEPIDQNLNYDFNFQQLVHLPKEHVVLPGDILVLQCEYDTRENDQVVTGGESTNEEMCLSFPAFYPRPPDGSALIQCISLPIQATSFNDFIGYLSTVNPTAAQQLIDQSVDGLTVLNGLDWEGDSQLAVSLQNSIFNSTVYGICANENGEDLFGSAKIPTPACSYQAPDGCSDTEVLGCCERLTMSGATRMEISVGVGVFMLIFSMLF